MQPLTQTDLLALLDAGEHVLLPSSYAAQSLRFAFDEHKRALGFDSWASTTATSWQQFTANLWSTVISSGEDDRILLNAAQEHLLWQAVLHDSLAETSSAAFVDSMAELAAGAFARAAAYNALDGLRAFANSPDTEAFAEWAAAFERRCAFDACLPVAQLDNALLARLGTLDLPQTLHLAGFVQLTPSQQDLLEGLRRYSVDIHLHDLAVPQFEPPRYMRAADPSHELRMSAAALAAVPHTSPGSRVTILLPDVAADRSELESALRQALAPELNDIASETISAPWSFATGEPLAANSLAATALDLLRLVHEPLPVERLSALLLSPYLGMEDARDAAAVLDAELRRRHVGLRPEIGLTALVAFRQRHPDPNGSPTTWAANLLHHLQRSELNTTRALTQPRLYVAWSEFARDCLRAAGWPGPRSLGVAETAAFDAFDSALDLLATLDFTGLRIPYRAWLTAFHRQVERSVVDLSSISAPIQIFSATSTEGLFFDRVLLLRATEANWPPAARPHPLLPFGLQRSLGMPGADFAGDRSAAELAMTDLLRRCGNFIATYADEDANGRLRPSPLLAACAVTAAAPPPALEPSLPVPLDRVPDDAALPPSPVHVPGGSRVLQLQAACGFRAFAELRLAAGTLDDASLGLDAAESGSLLHLTLQAFWKLTESRDKLRLLSRDQRIARLDTAIADALTVHRLQPGDEWDRVYLNLQKQRMRTLLLAWLEQEAERGPFTVVSTEDKTEIAVGPLTLSLRLDRVDKIEDSTGTGFVLVDYKTGSNVRLAHWDGERPDDPQLPLYALLHEPGELKGLAFARIRAGKDMKWQGYQAEAGILPTRGNPVRDLALASEEWSMTLTQLAHNFHDGHTDVRPKSVALNCRYCGQRLLCRLDPASLLANPNSDADDEEMVSD